MAQTTCKNVAALFLLSHLQFEFTAINILKKDSFFLL